ncbi:ABC transporter ATP-binding protein [Cryobacterium psychrophilum]|uniref:ABC transporter ATP-binding protein n=1 Tax=Cryobacterium psychrophilum TaxID=41988 RepID=A0A4Y8KJT4_9MICO|nr:ABC transporter ATP-binding protein [Cryobacterium psychrophilum]TDW30873.1 ABC-2 type transport system ATP-binding protein [Cryobacterium psychrophilum]TFD75739.1 ABC transporter ATP-binding protein [Cryobacterium psychrophilum]
MISSSPRRRTSPLTHVGPATHRSDTSADTPAHAIEVRNVTKRFGSNLALADVSFTIAPGRVFGVIGPNGAGKTTLMRTLHDIIRATSGSATVLGTDSRNAGPELRRRIDYLPGDLILEGRVSGRRLLQHYTDISGPVRDGRIEELADRLKLDLNRPVRKRSKGNKQKLGVIQAFMHDPELLVLDEPTTGLDPLMQQEFLSLVREASAAGKTVFLSSRVMSEIQQAADAVAILRDGRIVTIASVEELRNTAIRHLRMSATCVGTAEMAAILGAVPGVGGLQCTLIAANQTEATATLSGEIRPVIQAVGALQLTDPVLEEPDLEESVLTLYSAPAASAATTSTTRGRS